MAVISSHAKPATRRVQLSRALVWALLGAGLLADMFGILGGIWDGAYHARYLVDTFWSPPHLLIYSGMGGMLLLGLLILGLLLLAGRGSGGGLLRGNPLLLVTIVANLGFLATGPFDELWHSIFGRDQLTVWTVPHVILNANLALTSLGVVGLAVWLRARRPGGALAAPAEGSRTRLQNLAILVGLSAFLNHIWGFLGELESGSTALGPVPGLGWLYPLLGTLLVSLSLALASQLLPRRWWTVIPLVLVAQLWWLLPGLVLTQFGYEQVSGFVLTLTLGGLAWALIALVSQERPAWLRFAAFGAGYLLVVLAARLAGMLPHTTTLHLLLTAPLLPLAGLAGGWAGTQLGLLLQRLAGEAPRDGALSTLSRNAS